MADIHLSSSVGRCPALGGQTDCSGTSRRQNLFINALFAGSRWLNGLFPGLPTVLPDWDHLPDKLLAPRSLSGGLLLGSTWLDTPPPRAECQGGPQGWGNAVSVHCGFRHGWPSPDLLPHPHSQSVGRSQTPLLAVVGDTVTFCCPTSSSMAGGGIWGIGTKQLWAGSRRSPSSLPSNGCARCPVRGSAVRGRGEKG